MDLINQRLEELCDAAEHSPPVYRTQIASGIYLKNKLIAIGHNSYKTHPFQAKFGKHRECIYLHAEIDAIKNALKYIDVLSIKRCSLYVARVKWESTSKKLKIQGLARPCEGCARCIATFGIEEVFFTLDNEGYDML